MLKFFAAGFNKWTLTYHFVCIKELRKKKRKQLPWLTQRGRLMHLHLAVLFY
jgi:hypothetical protein